MVEPGVVDGLVERLDALRYHTLVPVDDDEVERAACEAADALLALKAEVEELRVQRDEAVQALADYRGQQYAPWGGRDPDDTIGEMIDNQAWVMMSHIGSFIGHRDGYSDLMERWQDDWADNYPQLLKGWFSPHRAAAKYIADRLTIRPAILSGESVK